MSDRSRRLQHCVFSSGKVSGWGSLPGVCGAAEQRVVLNVITPLGQSDNPPLRLSLNGRTVLWHIKRGSINMALTGVGVGGGERLLRARCHGLSWSAHKVTDI